MATVWAMARMNYLMYNLTQSAGYNRYTSWRGSNDSLNSLSTGFNGIRSGIAQEYATTSKAFDKEFTVTMDNLNESSDKLKKVDFYAAAAPTATDATKGETSEKNVAMENAVGVVKQFVKDYNASIDFFRKNANGSRRMTNLAGSFADTAYRARSYAKAGLNVDVTGKIKLDEEKLTAAIADDPERVSSLLGKGGLASKADTHVAAARAQEKYLFSSILPANGMSGGGYSRDGFSSSFVPAGNLLNFYI